MVFINVTKQYHILISNAITNIYFSLDLPLANEIGNHSWKFHNCKSVSPDPCLVVGEETCNSLLNLNYLICDLNRFFSLILIYIIFQLTIEHDPEEVSTRRQSFPFVSPCRNVSPLHDQPQKEGESFWSYFILCQCFLFIKRLCFCYSGTWTLLHFYFTLLTGLRDCLGMAFLFYAECPSFMIWA